VAVAAMGCAFEALVWGDDPQWCEGVATEALAEVERLDRQLSHYRSDSDIARLNAYAGSEWVRVEPALFELLQRCADWTRATGGAFDVAVGALLGAWGFHHGSGRIPGECEVRAALQASGMARVELDRETHLVHFASPDLALNLGAVGKGYALDCAGDVLRFYGVERAVVHGGQSTILAIGAPPGSDAWQFDIRDPRDRETVVATMSLRNAALSTSGSYRQYVEADGMQYGHILNPADGRPARGVVSVWLTAPSAAEADAMSTAAFVMGPGRAAAFAESRPHLAFIMLCDDGSAAAHVLKVGLP